MGERRFSQMALRGRTPSSVGAALVLVSACTKVPAGRAAIDSVQVAGAQALDEDEIADNLTTAPSPKFLGLFRGVVYDYTVYDASVLQRDLARVARYYRSKGF